MASSVLCVSWQHYDNDLATVCKSLLEREFLVDCTIAAEGQSLKAHRLILSAFSPFFQKLFSEEKEKYPIVILRDTVFDVLKTVIDFVYCGKVEIPENQLETFLDLAQTLQIKGLKNSLQNDRKTDCGNNSDGNGHQCVSGGNEDNCDVESSLPNYEESSSNFCQQYDYQLSRDFTDILPTGFSLPFERHNDPCEMVQLRAEVVPLQVFRSSSVENHPDESLNTEITVKHETQYSEIEILDIGNEIVSNAEQDKPTPRNLESELNSILPPPFEHALDLYSCSSEPLSIGTSLETPLQQHSDCSEYNSQQQHQRQITLQHDLLCTLSSPPEPEQHDLLLPEPKVMKSETLDYAEDEESTSVCDVVGNDEATEHLNQCSGAASGSPAQHWQADKAATDEQLHVCVCLTWQCSGCHAHFASSQSLEDHRRQHSGAGPSLCGASFGEDSCDGRPQAISTPDAFSVLQRMHTGAKYFSCDVCGKTFIALSKLTVHRRVHTGEKPFACDVCGKAFSHSGALTVHKRLHTGEKPFECDVCGTAFSQSGFLTFHKRCHTGEKPFACDVCGKAFTRSSNLVIHKRKHTGEKPFVCNVCGKAFIRSDQLANHMCQHTGVKPYKCNVCGKSFSRSRHLTIHKSLHTGEKPFACDVCGKAFSHSEALTIHKRLHTGEKPFACDVCGKTFSLSRVLTIHKRLHTGEKPLACDVCGKSFRHSSSFTIHKRLHTGEKPFACDVCGKAFRQSWYLTHHKRIHSGEKPFACDVCGKSFRHSSSFTIHKRLHTGEKPFACDVCGKAFRQSWYLTHHKRIHSGEKPFACDVCGKAFSRSGALTIHKRRHTEGRSFDCDACPLRFLTKPEFIAHWLRSHEKM